ncbi:hypothetical protein PR202_ga22630 [Eleusine coracana subsp. coracana]|uniref:DUF3615 domain-containing protein n=1 Tax=Eleusine coracana subsp. coracana TaxID=191504 RepID=A0AAV5D4M6_ELECO|nr:hypothetical protein PR202_ga22630 [Eleusine coracana subsp. coracana]
MDTGDSPNAGNPKRGDRRGATSRRPAAGNPKRRDRRGTRAAASGRPGVDDGVDPNRAAGLRRRELMLEIRRECQYLSEEIIRGGDGHYLLEMLRELGHRLRSSETPLQASSSAAPPSDHPGAEGSVTGTHIRQSALYSSRPRRPRRKHTPLPTQDHPSEVSTSELGGAVTDLPTLDEALSLSDPPPLTPQISDEETTDDDDASEEFIREMKEYSDKHPPVSLEEAFDSIRAVEHAALTALAAKKGIEPPRDPFLVDQEAPLLQAQQEDSASAPHSQDSIAISHEASTEVVQDGKQWMRDEVTLCFRKHVERTSYLAVCTVCLYVCMGVVFELDELCHQCFNVENYMKVFHHYNFKIRMKMPTAVEWTEELCFGEVKEIFGTKSYFCCPLEPNENGNISFVINKNQGVEDLRHPVTGGFETGLPDAPIPNFWGGRRDLQRRDPLGSRRSQRRTTTLSQSPSLRSLRRSLSSHRSSQLIGQETRTARVSCAPEGCKDLWTQQERETSLRFPLGILRWVALSLLSSGFQFPGTLLEERYWAGVQRRIGEELRRYLTRKGKSGLFVPQQYTTYQAMRRATCTDIEQYFTYLPGLAGLVTSPYRYWEDMVMKFYASLWVARDRSEIWFMLRGEPQRLTREDLIAAPRFRSTVVQECLHDLRSAPQTTGRDTASG